MFPRAKAGILAGIAAAAFLLPGVSRGEGFTLTQTISTSLLYESNANLASTSGKPASDYSLNIKPRTEILKEAPGFRLLGFYAPSGRTYIRNNDLKYLAHSAGVDMIVDLSEKSVFKASDVFGYSKDIRGIIVTGIQVSRANVLSNAASAGLTHKLTPRTSVSLGLSDALTQLSSSSGVSLGRADTASVSGVFSATETTDVTTSYSFSAFYFSSPAGKGGIEAHSVRIGGAHKFPYSLEVSASGGAAYTPSLKNQYTALYSAGIKKSFQRSTVAFDYSRSLINTALISKRLNVDDRYSLKWTYKVTESIDASAAGFYATDRTKPVAEVDLAAWGYTVAGAWRPYSWMTFAADYSHFNQTSKGSIGSGFKNDRASISVTFTAYEGRF